MIRRMRPLALLLALTASGCGGGGGEASALLSGPVPDVLIRFHLVRDDGAPGLESRAFEGETLYLDPAALGQDSDLARPALIIEQERWMLDVRFTADGGVRFDQAAWDHVGGRVAMLFDSQVVRVINLRPQLGASRLLIPLDLSDAEAARMQEVFAERWP